MRKQMNEEDFFERLRNLAQTDKVQVTEETKLGNLLDFKKGADGKTYGIVKEAAKFFIKTSSAKKEILDSSDFAYIGGIQNKKQERYNSLSEAQKNLNFKLISLAEAYEIDEDEEETPIADSAETPVPTEVPTTEPVADEPEKEEAPAEEPVAHEDVPETEKEEGHDDEHTDEDNSEFNEKDSRKLQSLAGKIGQEFKENNDVSFELKNELLKFLAFRMGFDGLSDKTLLDAKEKISAALGKDNSVEEGVMQEAEDDDMDDEMIHPVDHEEEHNEEADITEIPTIVEPAMSMAPKTGTKEIKIDLNNAIMNLTMESQTNDKIHKLIREAIQDHKNKKPISEETNKLKQIVRRKIAKILK